MPSAVTVIPAAASAAAREHFASEFAFETDCWDVHEALGAGADFVLLDGVCVTFRARLARAEVEASVLARARYSRGRTWRA
jgi:hypothetical protein